MFSNILRYLTRQIVFPDATIRKKYQTFKQLLDRDHRAHQLLAEFEDIFYNHRKADIKALETKYDALAESVSGMVQDLHALSGGTYDNLSDYFTKIDSCLRVINAPEKVFCGPPYTLALEQIGSDSEGVVGGKACNLAKLQHELKLPVPAGFVITTNAFQYFLKHNKLQPVIDQQLAGLVSSSPSLVGQVSRYLVPIIENSRIPPEVEKDILSVLANLTLRIGEKAKIALRSSAVAEDSALSFAGQYLSLLNVGVDSLLDSYRKVLASKYSPRALAYRIQHGILDSMTPMAVVVIEMIDAAVSGVITTVDPENMDGETLNIHSLWGLGGLLMGGKTAADVLTLSKKIQPEVIRRQGADKRQQMVVAPDGEARIVPVGDNERLAFSLSDEEASFLGSVGITVESYFQRAQEIEWCIDRHGSLHILQSRVLPIRNRSLPISTGIRTDRVVLIQGGVRASGGTGQGRVFTIEKESQLEDIPPDSVLIVRQTLPVYAVAMGRLRAVVAEQGDVAGHFSSVAREFGVPLLVKVEGVMTCLDQGQEITVDADNQVVYAGLDSTCQQKKNESCAFLDSPFRRKLQSMIRFISPLSLVDPKSSSFVPESCRSLHDIIRFVHEKSMAEMFSLGTERGPRYGSTRRLVSSVPLSLLLLDVGEGLSPSVGNSKDVSMEDVRSRPLLALWRGLTYPGIDWAGRTHFDWERYDSVVMAGGVVDKNSTAFASYAVIAQDYLNVNLRFGYHFTLLDTLCGEIPSDNYIVLRFAGGGGDFHGRLLRVKFLASILDTMGFTVEITGDLVDAKIVQMEERAVADTLDLVGRLLAVTRLLDMALKNEAMVAVCIDDFWAGRYDFSPCQKK